LIADTVQEMSSSAASADDCLIEEEIGCCDNDLIAARNNKKQEDQFPYGILVFFYASRKLKNQNNKFLDKWCINIWS